MTCAWSNASFEFSAIWVGALIPNQFSQFSRDRAIFPNCRKLMLGKALDFNGFRNYCGFRGSGPPASPRSTACSCLLFSNGMTTRDHSSGRPRWIRFREKLSRCRQTLEQIQPGCTLPRRRNRKQCPVNSWTPLAQLLHGLRLRQTIRGATSLLESPTCRAWWNPSAWCCVPGPLGTWVVSKYGERT